MKFEVRRTSVWDGCPCESAICEQMTPLDVRTAPTMEDARERAWFDRWFSDGVNHREENGHIVCDRKYTEPVWTLEISGMEEMLNFKKMYGDIIIMGSSYKELEYAIEIYDSYRE